MQPYQQYIGGVFRDGRSDRSFHVLNPSTGETLGSFAMASMEDIQDAIDAARHAFRTWSRSSGLERANLLRRTGNLMRERRDQLSRHISLELGKPTGEANREVDLAAEMFDWAAEESRRLYGRLIPARSQTVTQSALLEPIGPVGAFAGWNAPAVTPSRKVSSALAAGCSIVIKPSEETAGVALCIAQAAHDAGVPAGVLNMVFGEAASVADQLCESPDIAMITFTGATAIGAQLGSKAALTMKRATLELGGHAPVIVCADVDVERLAGAAVAAKYRNAGQVCTSPTRFLVDKKVFESFSDCFVTAARALRVGDPFAAGTQMGPLKNERRLAAVELMVQDARARGLDIAAGGRRIGGPGSFYEPTVIMHPDRDCEAARVEPFGPIALLSPFNTLDEALMEANRLPFALAAYAFTNRISDSHRLINEIESGAVAINEWQVSQPETPFGGYKYSGLGSEGGVEGLREFLKTKSVRMGTFA